MKKLALFLTTLLVATFGFANTTTPTKTQRSIAQAWRAKATNGVALSHDINMVYGGEDITPREDLQLASNIA